MSTAERVLVLWRHPVVALAVIPVAVAGVLQPLWMAVSAFRSAGPRTAATRLDASPPSAARDDCADHGKLLFLRSRAAGAFVLRRLPVSALFAFSCWDVRARAAGGRLRRLERVAMVVIGANMVLHAGLPIDRFLAQSLYVDRSLVAAAIADRNDRYLGDRRDTARGQQDREPRPIDPVDDAEAYRCRDGDRRSADHPARWTPVAGRISSFELTVTEPQPRRCLARHPLRDRLHGRRRRHRRSTRGRHQADPSAGRDPEPGRTSPTVGFRKAPTAATITIVGAEKVIPRRQSSRLSTTW